MSQSVFGENAKLHPITHMPLETGRGALSDDQQAMIQCNVIEQQQGKAAAAEMRAKVQAYIDGEQDGVEHEHQAKEI